MPVESVVPVMEIDGFLVCIVNRKKTADKLKFLSLCAICDPFLWRGFFMDPKNIHKKFNDKANK
ncbi:hypothetical protein MTP04_06390 [Lysinibacillus sp. PLM2]|nr:hypothetical protein MTP04_06390 [Lysinibacillus sp. PLM2]